MTLDYRNDLDEGDVGAMHEVANAALKEIELLEEGRDRTAEAARRYWGPIEPATEAA